MMLWLVQGWQMKMEKKGLLEQKGMSSRTEWGLWTHTQKKRKGSDITEAEQVHEPFPRLLWRIENELPIDRKEYVQNKEVGMPRLWQKMQGLAGNKASEHWVLVGLSWNSWERIACCVNRDLTGYQLNDKTCFMKQFFPKLKIVMLLKQYYKANTNNHFSFEQGV